MNDLPTDSFVGDAKGNTSREHDIEMGSRLPRSISESFNKQIQEVDKQVNKLSVLLQSLKEANEESKSVTKASSMKAIRKRMEKDVDEVRKKALNIKAKIVAIIDNIDSQVTDTVDHVQSETIMLRISRKWWETLTASQRMWTCFVFLLLFPSLIMATIALSMFRPWKN